jgi:hypothetical protein
MRLNKSNILSYILVMRRKCCWRRRYNCCGAVKTPPQTEIKTLFSKVEEKAQNVEN